METKVANLKDSVRRLLDAKRGHLPPVVVRNLEAILATPDGELPTFPFSKEEVSYIDGPEGYDYRYGHTCHNCVFYYGKNGRCALVRGHVRRGGSCNTWSEDGRLDLRFLGGDEYDLSKERLTAEEIGYIPAIEDLAKRPPPGVKAIGCRDCAWFGGKGCYPNKDPIDQFGCCNDFDAHSKDKNQKFTYLSGAELSRRLEQHGLSSTYIPPVHRED
jgi:hypothetical protein